MPRKTPSAQKTKLPVWTWIAPLLVCNIGTWMSLVLRNESGIPMLYFPIPFALAMIFWWGPRVLAGMAVNAVFSAAIMGLGKWYLWPAYAVPEILTVLTGWLVFSKIMKKDCNFSDWKVFFSFLFLVLVPVMVFDKFYLWVHILLSGNAETASVWQIWTILLFGCMTITVSALLFVTPRLEKYKLSMTRGSGRPLKSPGIKFSKVRMIEIIFAFSAVAVSSMFFSISSQWFIFSLFSLWAGLRFGLGLASLSNLWLFVWLILIPGIADFFRGIPLVQSRELLNDYMFLSGFCSFSLITGSIITSLYYELDQKGRNESETKDKQYFLDKIVNTSPNFIFIHDLNNHSNIYANRETLEFLGYDQKKIKESGNIIFEKMLHPDDLKKINEHHMDFSKADDTDILEVDYRIKDAEGEWRWIRSRDVVFSRNDDGRVEQILGVAVDITKRRNAEENLKKTLEEKETLLRELYHRTKNNMNVISALLDLQADSINDPRLAEAFSETKNRINSMALIHQKLYQAKDLSRLNLKEYLQDLIDLLQSGYKITPGTIKLQLDLEDISVPVDTAIPCGLVMNELISNAYKYAFPDGRSGNIRISMHRNKNNDIELSIADDGAGVPGNFDIKKDSRLGLNNVIIIVEGQPDGSVDFNFAKGVVCNIRFRDDLYNVRV